MKLINKYFIKPAVVLSSVALIGLNSCSDEFFNVNENPNSPGISTPSLTLPVAENYLASLNGTTMNYLGNYLMYNWANPSNWHANTELIRYDITSNFYGSIFEGSYINILKNLNYIENYESEGGDFSFYKGIATILKAYQFQYLVDLYGDVPYTEANQRGENPTPVYDKAEDIYKANIDNLTAVVGALDNLALDADNPGNQDIIFAGNVKKWQQLANTIKLRYLIRLSNTNQDAYIKGEIAKIKANGAGFITSDVLAGASSFYTDDTDKQSPFYGYFVKPTTLVQQDRGDYTVASDYTIDYLATNKDPRLELLYAPAGGEEGEYAGVWQEIDVPGGDEFQSQALSKVGPGLLKSGSQGQPIFLLTEALFLQAEAVQRGYMTGDAKKLYEDAITASFTYLTSGMGSPVPLLSSTAITSASKDKYTLDFEALGETYLETEDITNATQLAKAYYSQTRPNVGWDNSSDKIEAIITQKWIALNGINVESFLDFNRTGFPKNLPLPKEGGETRGHRPYRLLYPVSELARNANNVPKQTSDNAFNQKIFWQK